MKTANAGSNKPVPAIISLGRASQRASCSLPGIAAVWQPGDEQPPRQQHQAASDHPCLALLREGVTWPPALLQAPVVSYTTFSPLPAQ